MLGRSTKLAIIFVGIGIAVGVGIALAVVRSAEPQQWAVEDADSNPWLSPDFLKSYQEKLRTGAHYKSRLAVGEEGFFYADAKGGRTPYQFEWKFSDGVVLTSQNATRSFESPGNYSAVLTVSDAGGQQKNSNLVMRVSPAENVVNQTGSAQN